jgi:uncharacterized damage-inducible protein DinB
MHNPQAIVERLKSHPEEMRSLINGLTDNQRQQRPAKERWSLHELTMHLCDVQDAFIERVARMLTEDKPDISPYKPSEEQERGSHLKENFDKRLREFVLQRTTLIGLLDTLTDEQWQLEARHPEFKSYTIATAMEGLMRHEEHHLDQMFNIFYGMER